MRTATKTLLLVCLTLTVWQTVCGDDACLATTSRTRSSVTCYFHDNIGSTKKNFYVQFFYPLTTSAGETKLACSWENGVKLVCPNMRPGIQFDFKVTDILTITGPPMMDKVGGAFRCQGFRAPVTVDAHFCTLMYVDDAVTNATIVVEDDIKHDGTDVGLILAVISFVGFVVVLIILIIVICKLRRRDRRRQGDREIGQGSQVEDTVPLVTDEENTAGHQESNDTSLMRQNGAGAVEEVVEDADQQGGVTAGGDEGHVAQGGGKPHPAVLPVSQPQGAKQVDGKLDTKTTGVGAKQADEVKVKPKEQRILIIGKTGNGKSSLANSIIGDKKFRVGRGMQSTTKEPTEQSVEIRGKKVKVVDTPDFSNFNPKPTEPEARQQVLQWKSLTQPAPDVILLVVRCDIRYTKEEHDIYKEIKNLWGDDEQFCERLAVAFTFGDMQDKDLKEVLKTVCQELRSVLDDAGDRFFQINNKATGDEKQTQQMQMHKWLDGVVTGECLLIIGKTGSGKSSLANTITGQGVFPVGQSMAHTTTEPKEVTVNISRRKVKVIDTPDLTNLELGVEEKKQQVARWKEMAFPGPSAILLAVHGEIKFTQQERDVYEEVKKLWGDDNDFCCRLIIVFTFADRLEKSIVGALGGVSPELKGILAQAGNMCVEVSNTGSPEKKRQAVKKILDSVKTLG